MLKGEQYLNRYLLTGPQFQTIISCEGFWTIPWINQDNIDQVTFELIYWQVLNQFQCLKFGLLTTDLFSNKLVWKYYHVVCWITQQQHFPNTWFKFKVLFACKSRTWKLYRHCDSRLSWGPTKDGIWISEFPDPCLWSWNMEILTGTHHRLIGARRFVGYSIESQTGLSSLCASFYIPDNWIWSLRSRDIPF